MKARRAFLFLAALTLLRMVWVAWHDPAPSEAYFEMCSERLAPAFYDGPAGTAALLAAIRIAAPDPLQGARLLWPVLALLASLLAWRIARDMFDEDAAGWVVVFLNVLPAWNIAAIRVGPLLPAALLSTATIWAFRRVWLGERRYWLAAGLFSALAVQFRYEAILVPLGFLVAVLSSPRHRGPGDVPGLLWILASLALSLWAPLRWNAAWEWVPIAGGTLRTAWEWKPRLWWEGFTGAHTTVLGASFLLSGMVLLMREARRHGRAGLLVTVTIPVFAWWVYSALRGEADGAAALLATVPLAVFLAHAATRNLRATAVGAFFGLLSLAGTLLIIAREGETRGTWKSLADQLHAAIREMPAGEEDGFLIAADADAASILAHHLHAAPAQKGYPAIFVPESPDIPNQFGIWPSYADFVESDKVVDEYFTEQKGVNPFMGRNALYVGRDLPQTVKGAFAEVIPLKHVFVGGRENTIYLCLSYQTLPL